MKGDSSLFVILKVRDELGHRRNDSRYMTSSYKDEALMLQFQQEGDLAAFEELFRRHKDGFVTYLTRLSGNEAIAEDVSQQIWLKLIDVAKSARYSASAEFRAYLYTLGRNRYIDEYQRKHEATRGTPLTGNEKSVNSMSDQEQRPEFAASVHERADAVNSAIAALPLEQRDVIAMWANGMGFNVIGEITRAPRDTVISRKKYGIKKLRSMLEAAGITEDTL